MPTRKKKATPTPIRKKATKSRVEKPYNNGTMSVSAFWSFIRSALRQKSRWWKPISQCKTDAKRAYKGPNKRHKFEFKCAVCGNYFPDKQVNVDHINPAGQLNSFEDLPQFVKTLFCETDNLQVLCSSCHAKKTAMEKKDRKVNTLENNN